MITASKSAEGIKLEGDAKANAEKQMQLASVEAQLKLASEIGNNDGYQHYLIQVRQIEANEKVGLAQADNIKGADIKIIAGAGDVTGGISSAAGALSPKGGFNLAGMARFPRRNRRRQSPFGKIRIKNGRPRPNNPKSAKNKSLSVKQKGILLYVRRQFRTGLLILR